MVDRILTTFLDAGLLELNGQDAWFEHITTAADQLASHLAEHPHELTGYVYSAIHPNDRNNDPARTKTLEILRGVWRTFSSVSIGSLDLVLRGIILDAIVQNSNKDQQTKLAITLLLSSALPYIELGAEAKVWQATLDNLVNQIEAEAEVQWSVPTEVQLPAIPEYEVPEIRGLVSSVNINEAELVAGMEKAVGPSNAAGEQTDGNPQWPNSHQPWAQAFASFSADAINAGLKKAAGKRTFTLQAEELIDSLSEMVEDYIGLAASRLTAASHGVDLRSRLIWWKEAKISPSARVEYRSIPPEVIPGLIAFDYQQMLPPLAPVSVIAFLRESVRSIVDEATETTLGDYLKALSKADVFAGYRKQELSEGNACRPLALLVAAGISDAETISSLTVFTADTAMSPHDFSALLFVELQAMKAIHSIDPFTPNNDEGPDQEVADISQDEDPSTGE